MRVLIIGAGVMGCATALEISRRGGANIDVIVLERAVPGAEASSAAAGMLAAEIEGSAHPEQLSMFVEARNAYAAWALELRELSGGVDVGYRKTGALEIAHDDASFAQLRGVAVRGELVDGARARVIEPELAPSVVGARWFEEDAQVDPPQLLRALVASLSRRDSRVVIRSGATVSSLVHQSEEGGRCRGVVVDGGQGRETIHADAVVLAAGSWSSLVPGVTKEICDVRPIRGQLVMLEERPPRLSRIVFGHGGYIVPRGDGRVVCGSTMEDVGHRREVTAAGVSSILNVALAVAPRLAQAELSRVWCNFRPYDSSGAPHIGESSVPGLFLATGHHRNGILLAKHTADRVADAVFR